MTEKTFTMERKAIEVAPPYMRGCPFNHASILPDEAQHAAPIKMFLTRIGIDSKMIASGNVSQLAPPPKQQVGLNEAFRVLNHIKAIGFAEPVDRDVVRRRQRDIIAKAYKNQ